jgi:hypothetical protein
MESSKGTGGGGKANDIGIETGNGENTAGMGDIGVGETEGLGGVNCSPGTSLARLRKRLRGCQAGREFKY